MLESFFAFFIAFLGLFIIAIIIFRKNINRIMNLYFIAIIVLISFRFLLFGFYEINHSIYFYNFLKRYNYIYLIINPCVYLYFKNLIFVKEKTGINDLNHAILPFCFIIVDLLIELFPHGISSLYVFYYIFYISQTIYYLIKSFRILNKNVWKRKSKIEIVLKQNILLKNWTLFLFCAFTFLAIRMFFTLYFEMSNLTFPFNKKHLWVSMVLWFYIYIKIIMTPEILYGYNYILKMNDAASETKEFQKYFLKIEKQKMEIEDSQNQKLSENVKNNICNYITKINDGTLKNESFRNPRYSFSDFASALNIPSSHLQYLFKYHSRISYSDLKKVIRIQDSIRLIQSGYLKTNTLESLAIEVGFITYNTFYLSFKEIVGVKPIEYTKKYDKFHELDLNLLEKKFSTVAVS